MEGQWAHTPHANGTRRNSSETWRYVIAAGVWLQPAACTQPHRFAKAACEKVDDKWQEKRQQQKASGDAIQVRQNAEWNPSERKEQREASDATALFEMALQHLDADRPHRRQSQGAVIAELAAGGAG